MENDYTRSQESYNDYLNKAQKLVLAKNKQKYRLENSIRTNATSTDEESLIDNFRRKLENQQAHKFHERPVRVTLFSDEKILAEDPDTEKMELNFEENYSLSEKMSKKIMIFIGGGGFIASLEHIERHFLKEWTRELKIPIFQIHYKLAPGGQFPSQLNDLIVVYKSILYYFNKICKIELEDIVLVGDSAGGTLLAGLINYLIVSEFEGTMPSLAIYFYPATNLDSDRFTPSMLQAFDEKFLYFSVLEVCIESYIPKDSDPKKNFFLSPFHTPEEILQKHPRSMFLIGERDPLLDDGMKFALKLSLAGVKTSVKVYEGIFHGFLGFYLPYGQGIQEVKNCFKDVYKEVKEVLNLEI